MTITFNVLSLIGVVLLGYMFIAGDAVTESGPAHVATFSAAPATAQQEAVQTSLQVMDQTVAGEPITDRLAFR